MYTVLQKDIPKREIMKPSYSKQNSPSSAPNPRSRSEKMKQQILEYEQKKAEEAQHIQQREEDRGMLAAISIFQTVIGAIVTLVSHIVGVIPYLAHSGHMSIIGDVPFMLLIIFLWVVTPLLASSAVVYAIGRLKGYRGSYRATLLSGILSIAVYFFVISWFWALMLSAAVFDSIGEGPPAWSFFLLPPVWPFSLLLGSMFLLPIGETIGFHVSARRRTKR